MRETAGSTWTFQIIIIFILIFACFLALVLTYSKAYTIKNRVLTIIEKYNGITSESGEYINNFAREHSYRTTGVCPKEENGLNSWNGAIDLDGNYAIPANSNTKYYYCFRERKKDGLDGQIYYEIIVFYKFSLPFLGDFTTFRIEGTTQSFYGDENRLTNPSRR